jgi:hypothetical protein
MRRRDLALEGLSWPHRVKRDSTRLWKLPGQLLLAVINTTAILVIIAATLCSSRRRASISLPKTPLQR